MCFRRCRRSKFHSRCAFDAVDEVNFTPNVLSTLSTRQFLLPMCFRRCRRGNFHSRRAIRSPFWAFLLFGYGFIDYSGFSRASPLPLLRPRMDVAGAERGEEDRYYIIEHTNKGLWFRPSEGRYQYWVVAQHHLR